MPSSANVSSAGETVPHGEPAGPALAHAIKGSFLRALTAEARERICRTAELRTAQPRALLFRVGDRPTTLYLLLEGGVSLFGLAAEAREVSLDIVQPVGMVAPWAVLAGVPHSVSARVIRRARLACLPAMALHHELAHDNALARILLAETCRQTQALMTQIEDLKLRTTTERVGRYLLSLAPARGGGATLELPISKQLIASQLGMTPESLSRAFAALREIGVSISGNQVAIPEPAVLKRFCAPEA